jgi:hypothetical protein
VSNAKGDNHYAHQSSRKASHSPQRIDSRFECAKEVAVGHKQGSHSECRVPELNDSDGHVEAEEVEGALIAVTDAGLSPHAVVVQLVDALSATAAM